MIRNICQWVLYKRLGWKKDVAFELPEKYIICLAPHTSNWDLILGQLFEHAEGMKCNFLMKKEWFKGPLKPLFLHMGGIPVFRSKHTSMTDHLAQEAQQRETFGLCITPEGTRSPNPDWKHGFYYIALKAQIPVLLFGVDYKRKLIQCTRSFVPTGDIDKEMKEVKLYFKNFTGKHPENFTIGEV